jgi:hypothetical protein
MRRTALCSNTAALHRCHSTLAAVRLRRAAARWVRVRECLSTRCSVDAALRSVRYTLLLCCRALTARSPRASACSQAQTRALTLVLAPGAL